MKRGEQDEMPKMLATVGAVSDERAAEQIAEVTRVYAGKSETPRMTSAPKVIYLQYSAHENDYLKDYSDGITWCADKANSDDVEYIRADIHEAIEKEAVRLQEACIQLLAHWDRHGGPERFVTSDIADHMAYWSPAARLVDSEIISAIRALLSAAPTERADK